MKPLIAVMAHLDNQKGALGHSHSNNTYIESVNKAGGTPILVPTILDEESMDRLVSICDGFLFTGGLDISPCRYGEEPHTKLGGTDLRLDDLQIPFMQKVMKTRKPLLGICRGHQLLNVVCGGTLYQDISEVPGAYIKHMQATGSGDYSHHVTIKKDSLLFELFKQETIMTNSYHHQAVKDPGKNVEIIAHSMDGVIEGIQVKDYPFALGVQWHPEGMFAMNDESMRPIFKGLIDASLAGRR